LTGLLNRQAHGIFNIGHERGFSVREVIQAAESVVGKRVPCRAVGRRQGDPAILVANSEKSRRVLGWFPRCSDLETIVQTAWNWHAHNPFGFLDEQGNHGLEGSKGEQ
jgi:UDP-glucose 4-epimerase